MMGLPTTIETQILAPGNYFKNEFVKIISFGIDAIFFRSSHIWNFENKILA